MGKRQASIKHYHLMSMYMYVIGLLLNPGFNSMYYYYNQGIYMLVNVLLRLYLS